MAEFTCPRCNGSGTNNVTVTNWNTQQQENKTVTCDKCGGSGKVR